MELDPKDGIGRGVIHPRTVKAQFKVDRFHPSQALKDDVEHFWMVRWSLHEGESYTQYTIPHPSIHVVFEEGRAEIIGPISGRFERVLQGTGRVVGAHFRPGVFLRYCKIPIENLVDQRIDLHQAIPTLAGYQHSILQLEGSQSAAVFDGALLECQKRHAKPEAKIARDLVETIAHTPDVKKVEDLAQHFDLHRRAVQRLFKQYIGLTPKFVIQRYRLIEAADRLAQDPGRSADIAFELGYADQAHLIRAFKKLLGTTPEEYARRAQHNPAAGSA